MPTLDLHCGELSFVVDTKRKSLWAVARYTGLSVGFHVLWVALSVRSVRWQQGVHSPVLICQPWHGYQK